MTKRKKIKIKICPTLEYIVDEVDDALRKRVNDKEKKASRMEWTKDLTSSS